MKLDLPQNELITHTSDEFRAIHEMVDRNKPLIAKLNGEFLEQSKIREILATTTGENVDESVVINLPFYSDFGANIKFGKNIFINQGVMMSDLGGIDIGDNVLIAPRVTIVSVNHPLDPTTRRGVMLSRVKIGKNVWIGASATILPGVTIGENSVVAAGAVVSRDVPPNVVVAGIPAKIIKSIK